MWAQTCASSWCTRGGIADTETAAGCGHGRAGTHRPRAQPGRHALAEQEREAETGAVVGSTVPERDPPQRFVAGHQRRDAAPAPGRALARSASFFFLAPEGALEGAPVDGEAKAPPNVVEQRRRTERRVVGAERADNGHHGVVELVRAARAALARDQAGKAVRLERGLRVIEGRPGTAEGLGRLRDRVAVDLDPTQHFVFHLDQIPRIEKLVRSKQGVADRVGTGMQRPLGAERLGFGIATGRARGHCQYNYASLHATVSTPSIATPRLHPLILGDRMHLVAAMVRPCRGRRGVVYLTQAA